MARRRAWWVVSASILTWAAIMVSFALVSRSTDQFDVTYAFGIPTVLLLGILAGCVERRSGEAPD
jgi:flagellar biosynthesis protein FliR